MGGETEEVRRRGEQWGKESEARIALQMKGKAGGSIRRGGVEWW